MGNFFEVIRLSVELGLLALALTPVIVTGGIDLSVGSMMGLAAVCFGAAWRDWHWPIPAAALFALLLGSAGGALNALLITRLNIPPLIVTLGSFSMFRGIAEASRTAQSTIRTFRARSCIWAKATCSARCRCSFRSSSSRWRATRSAAPFGDRTRALRHRLHRWRSALCGYPGGRRVGLVYFLAGLVAASRPSSTWRISGRRNPTRAPATNWPPSPRSCWAGPRSSAGAGPIWGTIFGLFSISVLQNGLHLAALPSELTGVLTGTLLVLTIGIDRLRARAQQNAAILEETET